MHAPPDAQVRRAALLPECSPKIASVQPAQNNKPPAPLQAGTSPVAVSDPKFRDMLQLAGLRFMITRAQWLVSEARILGVALKNDEITSNELDDKLAEMGALDIVYPELMGGDA